MSTLADVICQSIDEISTALNDIECSWEFCRDADNRLAAQANLLEKSYRDFKLVVRLALASYFLSFLVLFFHKKGPVKSADILAIDQMDGLLSYLAGIFADENPDKNQNAPPSSSNFLNRWLSEDSPFSAHRATDNFILDLLIQCDQRNQTKLAGRLMNDISYLVYALANQDKQVSYSEKQLLNFLNLETEKVKSAIGDDSVFDFKTYGESLCQKGAEKLLAEARNQLDELIGLNAIKHEIKRLEAFLRIRKLRETQGLAVADLALHFVFKGNPGTGKTTVARILGKLFKGLGFLQKGHVVETDRSGLVAEYLGQTAVKTRAAAESALDGILFVDEAYGLSRNSGSGGSDNYGKEAIETMLKFMEDNRKRVVVIVAGYPALMNDFIETNPGLKSRFTRYLNFDDFKPNELCRIIQLFTKKAQYSFTPEGCAVIRHIFAKAYEQRGDGFGNARFARNVFEETIQNQAMRLTTAEDIPTKDILMTLELGDLPKKIENVSFSLDDLEQDDTLCLNCPDDTCCSEKSQNDLPVIR